METHFYRFRAIKYLLEDPYKELEAQSIYFAPSVEMNDPMEGFKDIFWDGDDIAWKNLFRHFVQCLSHAFFHFCIRHETTEISWNDIPIKDVRHDGINDKIRQILDEILDEIFSRPSVHDYVDAIAKAKRQVRREELEFHLRKVQSLAMPCIGKVLHRHNLVPPFENVEDVIKDAEDKIVKAAESVQVGELVADSKIEKNHAVEVVFASLNRSIIQMALIDHHNGLIDRSLKNRNFIYLDFPSGYVRKIECLVYPDWNLACFSSNFHNSSLWGTYGNSHTGACLKFKAKVVDGVPNLRLNRAFGWSSDGPVRGPVEDQFQRVEYQSKFVAVDFFRSLGSIAIGVLNRDWHYSEDHRPSACALGGDFTDEQRKEFWRTFARSATTKLQDWSFEEEVRLIQHGFGSEYSDQALRLATYDFADLEGIIFGMNTKEEDKLKMMKIINEKCVSDHRDGFKFFQAYYSPVSGRIEAAELGLLKVSLDKKG